MTTRKFSDEIIAIANQYNVAPSTIYTWQFKSAKRGITMEEYAATRKVGSPKRQASELDQSTLRQQNNRIFYGTRTVNYTKTDTGWICYTSKINKSGSVMPE